MITLRQRQTFDNILALHATNSLTLQRNYNVKEVGPDQPVFSFTGKRQCRLLNQYSKLLWLAGGSYRNHFFAFSACFSSRQQRRGLHRLCLLTVIVYRALHGTAPRYLSDQLQYVADLPSRRRGRLRSSTSSLLDVRQSRLLTVGDRSFATAGPRLWNSLPVDIQSAPSLTTFRHKLKTHLFRQSYCILTASL